MSLPRSLGGVVGRVTREAVGRKAAALGALIGDWPAVARDGAALNARPIDIAFPRGAPSGGQGGVLTLACDPADALVLQHDLDRIRERVNTFFGHAAIARIKLVQAPQALRSQTRRPAPTRAPGPDERSEIEALLAEVDDPDLHARLRQWGERLWTRSEEA